MKQLTEMILSRAQPKRFGSMGAMTGPVLAGLVGAYVGAMNNGAVPTIATAWQVRWAGAGGVGVGGEVVDTSPNQTEPNAGGVGGWCGRRRAAVREAESGGAGGGEHGQRVDDWLSGGEVACSTNLGWVGRG